MKTVTDAGNAADTPKTFASNQGEIMVEKGNPDHITSVSQLANPAVKVVVCARRCRAAPWPRPYSRTPT